MNTNESDQKRVLLRTVLAGLTLPGALLSPTLSTASTFEGHLSATLMRGAETRSFLYTVGTTFLRIERTETNWPYTKNIVELDSGALTLVCPHNRSFVRLKPAAQVASALPPGVPTMPAGLPPGIGPQTPVAASQPARIGPTRIAASPPAPVIPQLPQGLPPGIGPQSGTGMSPLVPAVAGMPVMSVMPMPVEKLELKATGETTNLLGFACARYELRQRGETMEIWATDKLLPFQLYLQNQPPHFGPRMMEEQWSGLLRARKLFPLLAVLRSERPSISPGSGPSVAAPERLRFEVKSVTPEKIDDREGTLFQPPPDYHELQRLSF